MSCRADHSCRSKLLVNNLVVGDKEQDPFSDARTFFVRFRSSLKSFMLYVALHLLDVMVRMNAASRERLLTRTTNAHHERIATFAEYTHIQHVLHGVFEQPDPPPAFVFVLERMMHDFTQTHRGHLVVNQVQVLAKWQKISGSVFVTKEACHVHRRKFFFDWLPQGLVLLES